MTFKNSGFLLADGQSTKPIDNTFTVRNQGVLLRGTADDSYPLYVRIERRDGDYEWLDTGIVIDGSTDVHFPVWESGTYRLGDVDQVFTPATIVRYDEIEKDEERRYLSSGGVSSPSVPAGGAVSQLVDHGDGTFTHDNGNGTSVNFAVSQVGISKVFSAVSEATMPADVKTGTVLCLAAYIDVDATGGDVDLSAWMPTGLVDGAVVTIYKSDNTKNTIIFNQYHFVDTQDETMNLKYFAATNEFRVI